EHVEQLLDVEPPRKEQNPTQVGGLLHVDARLSMHGLDPPEREADAQERHQQAHELRPRHRWTLASTQTCQQEIAERDQGEYGSDLSDQERDRRQPTPDEQIPRTLALDPSHV